jgi:glycosyltransferase involved in cell wall biosynthesis
MRLGQAAGWAMKHPAQNWLPLAVIRELLDLAGFDVVRTSGRVLWPRRVPGLSSALNRVVSRLPALHRLCLVNTVVARPRRSNARVSTPTCSVIVPCRNERGTIDAIVRRLPEMGGRTEVIFVDGHSTDGTVDEIERVIRANPARNLKLVRQDGNGKGDAVRLGFARATGDVLMILDADMTVAPEELPKFYEALVSGYGEFINGTRLVYPMDGQAMQLLNLVANKAFSALFSYLLEQRFHDTLCGTKALWRSDYELIAAQRSYFGDLDPFGDFDLLFGASRLNLKIREVPVRYSERVYGQTNIKRFSHGWQLLKMCWLAMPRLKFAR